VDVYEDVRPSYPRVAVEFLANELGFNDKSKRKVVVELGSGTGKFTRLLIPYMQEQKSDGGGAIEKLIAVEPSLQMRQKLLEVIKSENTLIQVLDGNGENIPAESHSVDTVVAAQAFHWFATMKTLEEIHRVLKPGGKFLCIWNLLDDRVEWVRQFRDLFERYESGSPQYRLMKWRTVFDDEDHGRRFTYPLKEKHFHWTWQNRTPDQIWNELLSKSYVSAMNKTEQDSLKMEVDNLLDKNLKIYGNNPNDKRVEVPYNTDLAWTQVNK
ncbi:unnamed protein product, partial [Didymodactylos carnosus]